MQLTVSAKELSHLLNGTIEGNPSIKVHDIAKIEEASEGTLSFLANPKYLPFAYTTQASILIISEDMVLEKAVTPTLIRVKNAYKSINFLLEKFQQNNRKTGKETPHFIHASAKIGEQVYIGAFAYIGQNALIGNKVQLYPQTYIGDNVQIGENTIIHAGVKIYADCQIGSNCILHSGTIIGSDGFGFAPQADGTFKKVPQTGKVIVEDNVEIGANTSIDRATIGATIIKKGVKLDNLIQVAHNVEIGENTVIAAQTGISGSTKLGQNCMIGGQVGFIGHIQVANGTKINAQSGITKTVKNADIPLMGSPAMSYRDFLHSYVGFKQLPKLQKRIKQLEQTIKMLQDQTK